MHTYCLLRRTPPPLRGMGKMRRDEMRRVGTMLSAKRYYEQIGVAMTCRSYAEYVRMFDLREGELSAGEVLDVAAGGSSFTAELAGRGQTQAIAADPRYAMRTEEWMEEAAKEIEVSYAKLAKLTDVYDWSYYETPERHREGRLRSLDVMRSDAGSLEGRERYIAGALPQLPFQDNRFSLVLCSHFLFLYGEQFDYSFHLESILEMMRVCKPGGQVKIYPLVSFAQEQDRNLDTLMEAVIKAGGVPELLESQLPFIPGSVYFLNITN